MFGAYRAQSRNDDSSKTYKGSARRLHGLLNRCLLSGLLGALLFTVILSMIYLSSESSKRVRTPSLTWLRDYNVAPAVTKALPKKNGLFHLLIPANQRDVNLCKTILSAKILGYPTPVLVDWEQKNVTNAKMAMIPGTLAFINTLSMRNDEDLILVVDGYDIWFQLSPQIMIDRYHQMNQRADERLHTRLGKNIMNTEGISQKIVISSQKNCWPGNGDDVQCYAVPESPLPRYIYGPQTDTIAKGRKDLYPQQRLRQRWLNSGFILGPVKDMRRLYERAQERAITDINMIGDDQGVFARIWGQQEYQREFLSPRGGGPWKRGIAASPPRKAFEAEKGTNYEFGVGLDYGSELSQPTKYCEHDLEWLVFGNRSSIDEAVKAQEITHTRADTLPADLINEPPPFTSLGRGSPSILPGTPLPNSWNDTPLWTNLWTGTIPAIVHHNAHKDDLKSLRKTLWNRMWFQPYARALLQASEPEGAQPMAVDKKKKAWSSSSTRSLGLGAKTINETQSGWVTWNELCSIEDQEEVFRDDGGPWAEQAG